MTLGSIHKSSSRRQPSNEDHWSVLAFSRFLLALWILVDHVHNFATHDHVPIFDLCGIGAVYGFLAISGFSIHASFSAQPHKFYYRRFCRIFPVHIATLVMAVVACLLVSDLSLNPMPQIWDWIGCFFLLQAVLPVAINVIFPAWSLSIEVFYYAITPLIAQIKMRYLVALTVVTALACAVRVHYFNGYLGTDTYGLSILLMLWCYLSGWLIFKCYRDYWCFPFTAICGIICLFVEAHTTPGSSLLPNRDVVAGFDGLIWTAIIASMCFFQKISLFPWIAVLFNYLGEISYPIYLMQYPTMTLLKFTLVVNHPSLAVPLFYMPCVILVSILVHHLIEVPARGALKRMA